MAFRMPCRLGGRWGAHRDALSHVGLKSFECVSRFSRVLLKILTHTGCVEPLSDSATPVVHMRHAAMLPCGRATRRERRHGRKSAAAGAWRTLERSDTCTRGRVQVAAAGATSLPLAARDHHASPPRLPRPRTPRRCLYGLRSGAAISAKDKEKKRGPTRTSNGLRPPRTRRASSCRADSSRGLALATRWLTLPVTCAVVFE